MHVYLTPPQCAATLAALRARLSDMEGVYRRLKSRYPESARLVPIGIELTQIRLAISAHEEAVNSL